MAEDWLYSYTMLALTIQSFTYLKLLGISRKYANLDLAPTLNAIQETVHFPDRHHILHLADRRSHLAAEEVEGTVDHRIRLGFHQGVRHHTMRELAHTSFVFRDQN